MKQPELGLKISELRSLNGITQKELSEACRMDIRTIQRIESGEVTPRATSLKLIAEALACDIRTFTDDQRPAEVALSGKFLLAVLIASVIYLTTVVLLSPVFPPSNAIFSLYPVLWFVDVVAGVFLYFGFFNLGKLRSNRLLQISSAAFMAIIPLLMLTSLIEGSVVKHIQQLIIILNALNCILFGIGLWVNRGRLTNLYRITGIVHFIIAPLIVISVPIIALIAWWLIFLSVLLQVSMVYLEFRNAATRPSTEAIL